MQLLTIFLSLLLHYVAATLWNTMYSNVSPRIKDDDDQQKEKKIDNTTDELE